ncbi:MAG: adenosine kinase [Candidatus Micrarchaeota archaeon]|nr:adenosine kinase [Candidatus Micrarchaeota archaeon]
MDLFALGTPVIDFFAKAQEKKIDELGLAKGATTYVLPKRFTKIKNALGKKIAFSYPGDNARNVCEGFAALGGFAGYQGAVGSDREGALFEANLQECGIASFLEEKKGRTGKIIVLVTPDAQRTFCADLGVSGSASFFEKYAVAESRMFFVSSITLCVEGKVSALAKRYLDAFKKMGRKIAISLENPPAVKKNKKMIAAICKKYADVLFMNEEEAGALLGTGFERKLRSFKPSVPVYLKRGKRGSALFFRGKVHYIAAPKGKAIDTTGAGDAYAAGVLYGISRGYSPVGSGRVGSALAGAVIKSLGPSVPLKHTRIRIRHARHRRLS